MKRNIVLIAVLALAACDGFPKDPAGSLPEIRDRGAIRVGVIEHQPWTRRTADGPAGVEPDLVRAFAHHLRVRADWTYLPEAEAAERLQRHELDLVIGGLNAASPRKTEIGLTRAYCRTGDGPKGEHVLAAPQGENGLITALEKFLARHEAALQARCIRDRSGGKDAAV